MECTCYGKRVKFALAKETKNVSRCRGFSIPAEPGPQSGSVPARRELDLASQLPTQSPTLSADAPPSWFIDFEKRQKGEFESLLDLKLRDLVNKVAKHDDQIQSLAFENQELQDSMIKSLKEKKSSHRSQARRHRESSQETKPSGVRPERDKSRPKGELSGSCDQVSSLRRSPQGRCQPNRAMP